MAFKLHLVSGAVINIRSFFIPDQNNTSYAYGVFFSLEANIDDILKKFKAPYDESVNYKKTRFGFIPLDRLDYIEPEPYEQQKVTESELFEIFKSNGYKIPFIDDYKVTY